MKSNIHGGGRRVVLPPPPLQLEHLTQRQVSMKFLHAAAFAVVLTHWSDQDDVYIVLIRRLLLSEYPSPRNSFASHPRRLKAAGSSLGLHRIKARRCATIDAIQFLQ